MSRKKTLAMTVLIGSGAAVFHGESVVARGPDSSGGIRVRRQTEPADGFSAWGIRLALC